VEVRQRGGGVEEQKSREASEEGEILYSVINLTNR
jgi:hypothetical protein